MAGEPRPARGGVRFTLDVDDSSIDLGDGVRVSLWSDSTSGVPRSSSRILAYVELNRPRAQTTPGGFNQLRWLHSLGAALSGRVRGVAWREVTPPLPSPVRILRALEARWSERLSVRIPGPSGDFVRALVLGERGQVSPEVIDDFRRAGVLHLLALSGQHVALVAALLLSLARLTGIGIRGETLIVMVGVWCYAILTGASPSVVRAALGSSLHLLALLLGRKSNGFEVLGWSAAIGALAAPRLGVHIGFQLSCLASAGLVTAAAVGKRVGRAMELRFAGIFTAGRGEQHPAWPLRFLSSVFRLLLSLSSATAAAQLAVLPLLAANFGAVSLVSLASNVVLVPVCALLLSAALPLLVFDSLLPTPAVLWQSLAALAALALEAGERFSSWPGARLPCSLSAPWATAAVGLLGLGVALWVWSETQRGRFAGAAASLSCASLGLWLGILLWSFWPQPPRPTATLSYWLLDVGQGDCQVLEFGDGKVMVIDTGDARRGYDAGARVLVPFLRARGHRHVDQVVITHEDRDHAGGWRALADDLAVGSLASGVETLAALDEGGSLTGWPGRRDTVAAGDTLATGSGYLVRVLWPPGGATELSANARSVVIEVDVGGRRLYLPGDPDSTIEKRWQDSITPPAVLLKLSHHGSGSSTPRSLLERARPWLAVVSCGRSNRFGHPHLDTLERLRDAGVPLRRTDREGTLRLDFGPEPALSVTTRGRLTPHR